MPTAGLGTFSKLLIAVLIAQVLLTTQAAVISKREIAAGGSGATATGLAEHAHDPDPVAVGAVAHSEQGKDGQSAVEEKIESATRKSTKLLPHSGSNSNSNSNSNYRADDFRTSGKLVLNRVAAEPLKMEVDVKETDAEADVNVVRGEAVQAARVTETPSATESSIFSHNAAVSAESTSRPPATVAISGNVNNGLDELATEQKSDVSLESESKTQSAGTEEVLPELERVALRPVTANANDAVPDTAATTATPLPAVRSEAAGAEQVISHSSENQLEEAVTKRIEPQPKPSENHTTAVSAATDAVPAAIHNPLALPELIASTTTATVTTTNRYRDAVPMESGASTPSKTKTPTNATATTSAQMLVDSAGGESNEVRSNGSAEKRAKFISDNSTNAQQLNLPDAAEVWTLAGMKTVPHANVSGAASASQESGKALVLDSTEAALNNSAVYSNSEKNLLDWTQIMMNGAMDGKRLDSLMERSTTQPAATDESAAVTLATLGVDGSSEKRTELQINSTVDTTDGALEHATPAPVSTEGVVRPPGGVSTHLPQQVNEVGIEMTTARAGAGSDVKSLESPNVISTAGLMPAATTEAAHAATSTIAARQSAPISTTTLSVNSLSADNADKRSSEEVLVANGTVTAATTSLPEGSKIESEIAEATTLKSPDPDASAMLVTSTTTAPPPTSTPMPTPTPTPSSLGAEPVASTTAPPLPVTVSSASNVLPPAHMLNSTGNNNNNNNGDPLDASNNKNHNNDNNNDSADVDVNASVNRNADADRATNSGSGIATLEHSSSETTTLSTLAASEPNTTSASVGDSNSTPRVPFSSAHNENRVAAATTTETTATTSTTTTTALPAVLVVNTGPKAPAEVGQIGNEVELESSSERTASTATSSSTIKRTHSSGDNEDGEPVDSGTTATTTSSPVNELLITTTTTTITTTAKPTTTEKAATPIEELVEASTSIPLQVAIKTTTPITTTSAPLGSATVANSTSKTVAPTTTTTETATETETTTAAPTAVTEDRKANEVSNSASHETETSIETNVIDQLDKPTVKTTTTTITPAPAPAPFGETNKKDITSAESETEANSLGGAEDNNDNTLTHETTMAILTLNATTVASRVPNVISASTTTEPPLINLLDDSTSTTTTTTKSPTSTTVSSIATKIQEVYSVFSTTTSTESGAESNHTAAPTAPTSVPRLTDSTSTPVVVTTMLPPAPTLHATIGGTHLPGMTSGNVHPNATDANETDVNVIIAITVSVIGVVALILLVAFLYLIRKRQKQMSYGQRCRPVSLDDYSLDNVSVLGSVRRKGALRASKRSYGNVAFDDPSLRHNVLTASELVKFVERRSSIFEEFRDVPQITARADEVPHGCEDKNRYANVIPLPETRVILQQQLDDEKTEYINANYVRGPKDAPNYYIATQAPLETTVFDFWRMIWEQQSRVIIQATDLIENGIEKCAEYLPPSATLDNHTTYGDFQITLKHREVKDKYAISTIVLKNTAENASRELTHYWYKWPEAGVPSEEAPIIAMLLEVRSSLKSYANEPKEKSATLALKPEGSAENSASGNGVTVVAVEPSGERKDADSGGKAEINGNVSADRLRSSTARNQGPLTIHCSPGTGRTGTIIACDMAIRSLETPKRSVDIPQIVYYVRRGRASAVQTKEQYEFIYKVAHMYATKITNLSNDN